MISLALDMVQYDCPFIDTTERYELSFGSLHWEFNRGTRQLETRMVVEGADEVELENGLDALRQHDNFHDVECLTKHSDSAMLRTVIGETEAMRTIRDHDGFITGAFHIEDGSELWNVGFDTSMVADNALSELEKHNDFTVESRSDLSVSQLGILSRNIDAATTLISGCNTLTAVERRTIESAVRNGYYDTPREANQATIGDELGVSSPAVSKNLRRAQRKINEHVVEALDIKPPSLRTASEPRW